MKYTLQLQETVKKLQLSCGFDSDLDVKIRSIELSHGGEEDKGLRTNTLPVLGIPFFSNVEVYEPDGSVLLGDTRKTLSEEVTTHSGKLGEVGESSVEEELQLGKLASFQFFSPLNLKDIDFI